MTVKTLIAKLSKVKNKNKPVNILLFVADQNGRYNQFTNHLGHAISSNPCKGVKEFDDYVALKRT